MLREKEINKENCLGKSILNILNIDNFKKKNKLKQDEKGEEKSEEDKKSEKEKKVDNINEKKK